MEILKEILSSVVALVGLFALFYFGAYFIELGRLKARRKLQACDLCFGKMKRMNEE